MGQFAAFCVGWLDQSGPDMHTCGQIEPLGVHPDLQHLGLGRAVLAEALRRLRELGAKEIYVETDSYRDEALELYKSAGFLGDREVLVFRKDLE